ncbi:hypothetical protein VNO77_27517 [Canavalia gladiata]|uniref:Uncharacterized protein n=1 Tax=Canavalia gladiata TaxID=3824 RepID=A0AAN9KUU3_CANGL
MGIFWNGQGHFRDSVIRDRMGINDLEKDRIGIVELGHTGFGKELKNARREVRTMDAEFMYPPFDQSSHSNLWLYGENLVSELRPPMIGGFLPTTLPTNNHL